jgi:hypothetical protein
MTGKLFEMLISRSLDARKPLPGWLRRWASRNTNRERFAREMQSLDVALRTSARQNRDSLPDAPARPLLTPLPRPTAAAGRFSPRSNRWGRVVAALAAAWLVMFSYQRHYENTANAERLTYLGQEMAAVPTGMLTLLNYTAQSSQNQIAHWSPTRRMPLPEMPRWEDVRLQSSDLWELNRLPAGIGWPRFVPRVGVPEVLPVDSESGEPIAG